MLSTKEKIHFIGIGGIGMSGIARILNFTGRAVSGSDVRNSSIIKEMRKEGIKCFIGHKKENIANCDIAVYSSAIDSDNSELKAARRRRIKIMHRADMLSEMLAQKKGIAITGSHGKTTTSALTALLFKDAGLDPSAAIGGEVLNFGSNILCGMGDYFVAEADESDGSFLKFRPDIAVLLNIDKEHMNYFKDINNALNIYKKFTDNVKTGGAVYYNSDDRYLKDVLKSYRGKKVTFGLKGDPDIKAFDIKEEALSVRFRCSVRGKEMPNVLTFPKPGRHNVLNTLAAIAVAHDAGIDFEKIKDSIRHYKGTKRRFEIKDTPSEVMVVEDYAHHPTEIKAVLSSCRSLEKNLIVVFQPHRYTRTKELFKDFLKCFGEADRLILTDIYAASEKPIRGVSARRLCSEMKRLGKSSVEYLKKEAIVNRIKGITKKNDMILILGAGDVNEIASELETFFNNKGVL
ncbi:MAG: UDP-N-acetylmuramate--L-alanine ligase [Candidatus Omnitrophota bacterium]